jgi:hypothetical protein
MATRPFDLFDRRHDAVLRVAVHQVVDARYEGVGVAETHQRQHFGNSDLEIEGILVVRAFGFGPQDADCGQGCPLLSVVKGFESREFHRLHPGHDRSRAVARECGNQSEYQTENRSDGDALASHLLFAAAEQVPGADGADEQRGQHERRGDRMGELIDRYGREEYVPEGGHLVADGVDVEGAAYRILHPGVRYQDPEGRQIGADGREPGGGEMEASADAVPAEEHDGYERAFEEEGQDAFDGQRRAENVADEVGVVRPVGAEFEFEDEARGYADGEIDTEQAHPEFRRAFPEGIARAVVDGFHDRADDA